MFRDREDMKREKERENGKNISNISDFDGISKVFEVCIIHYL
jgi:hypothetical protein